MATERLAPDAILTQTGLSGAVTAIQDDPDSPDGSWLTTTSSGGTLRVSFPTPSPNLDQGTGLQEFRVLLRKNASGGGTPTADIHLYENGTDLGALILDTAVTSTTGEVLAATWAASSLSNISGSNVELYMDCVKGGGGPNERNVEVGAVEWNVSYTAPVQPPLEITPSPASATATGVDPNTVQGSITVTPTPASSTATAVDPVIQEPPLIISTTPATASSETVVSQVVYGSLNIRAPPNEVATSVVSPTVVESSISITAEPATVVCLGVNPSTVQGSIVISTTPTTATATAIDPTVSVGALVVTPTPASVSSEVVAPAVVQSSITVTTTPAEIAGTGVDPTTVLGSLTIIPGPRGGGSGEPIESRSLFVNYGGEDGVDGSNFALNWQSGSAYDVMDASNQGFDNVTTQSVAAPEGTHVLQAAVGGYSWVVSEERIPVSPTDTPLSMSGAFKRVAGTANLYFGLLSYDSAGALIRNPAVWLEPTAEETTLAADVNINDTTVSLTSTTGWYNGGVGRAIQFNIENDQSDLPNHDWQFMDGYTGTTVTLTEPSPKFYAAGTKVRQTRGAGSANDTIKFGTPAAFEVWSGSIEANNYMSAGSPPNATSWRFGTAFVTPYVLYTGAGTFQWDDINFTQLILPTETEGAAYTTFTAIDPTVLYGDIHYTPTPASVTTAGAEPTVVQSSISVTPTPATATATGVEPAVSIGALVVSPSPATATATAVEPNISIGAVVVRPSAVTAAVTTVEPNTVQSSLTITPSVVFASTVTVDPQTTLGTLSITPSPSTAVITGVDPTTIQGPLTLSPTAASAATDGVDPTTVQTSLDITPSAVFSTATTVDPTVSIGALIVTSDPATISATTVDPAVVQNSINISPVPVEVVATTVNPAVSGGGEVVTPAPATASTTVVTPTIIQTSVAVTPAVVTAVVETVDPSISIGALVVTTTPASAAVESVDPSVLLGDLQLSSTPATAGTEAADPTVVQASVTVTPLPATVLTTTLVGNVAVVIPGKNPFEGLAADTVVIPDTREDTVTIVTLYTNTVTLAQNTAEVVIITHYRNTVTIEEEEETSNVLIQWN